MKTYFEKFKKIATLMEKLSNDAKRTKVAISLVDKRRIDLGAVDWDNPAHASHAKNKARNLTFQGTGASITKLALTYIYDEIIKNNYDAQIVNVVHDEILITCHKDIADIMKKITEEKMIQAFNYFCPDVPMNVVAEVGTHWIH